MEEFTRENGKTASSTVEEFFVRRIFQDREYGKMESAFSGLMKQNRISKRIGKSKYRAKNDKLNYSYIYNKVS